MTSKSSVHACTAASWLSFDQLLLFKYMIFSVRIASKCAFNRVHFVIRWCL